MPPVSPVTPCVLSCHTDQSDLIAWKCETKADKCLASTTEDLFNLEQKKIAANPTNNCSATQFRGSAGKGLSHVTCGKETYEEKVSLIRI